LSQAVALFSSYKFLVDKILSMR